MLGESTTCDVCGAKLKFFPAGQNIRYVCPNGRGGEDGHAFFVFLRSEW